MVESSVMRQSYFNTPDTTYQQWRWAYKVCKRDANYNERTDKANDFFEFDEDQNWQIEMFYQECIQKNNFSSANLQQETKDKLRTDLYTKLKVHALILTLGFKLIAAPKRKDS